jgi:hypothetical protein
MHFDSCQLSMTIITACQEITSMVSPDFPSDDNKKTCLNIYLRVNILSKTLKLSEYFTNSQTYCN